MKQIIRLTEGDLHRIIRNSVNEAINEVSYKTALAAADARADRYAQTRNNKDFDQAYDNYRSAEDRFRDEYVRPYHLDRMDNKMRGKHSSTFNVRFGKDSKDPYHAITGYNKSGNKLMAMDRDAYYSDNGYVTPIQHFRDKEMADAYQKACDELWDYNDGKYHYEKGKGWVK